MHPTLYIRNIEAIFIVVLWAVVEASLHVVRELPQDLSTGPFLPNPLNNTVGKGLFLMYATVWKTAWN